MKDYSDEDLLTSISQGGKALEYAMRHLYLEHACRTQIFAFILGKNGTQEDAEDIFQDGIRYLVMQLRAGKYEGKGDVGGYLFGICRNLWFKRFKQIQRIAPLPAQINEDFQLETDPEKLLIQKDKQLQLDLLLGKLGVACRKVLELWKLSYSMKEIAKEMSYKNEAVARKKKRLCLIKLIEVIEQSPDWESRLK